MTIDCVIYRCARQPEMYLFMRADVDVDALPDALRQRLGRLSHVMDLQLTPERRLARAQTVEVMRLLSETGWYLQMPPAEALDVRLTRGG